jgi:hypothetical protein
MTSSTQILPSLLFLAVGGVGLLWLSEPSRVGAAPAGERPTPPVQAFASRPPEARRAPVATPGIRWPGARSSDAHPSAGAPAQVFGPGDIALLRKGIEERRERDRQERLRAREAAQDAWFAQRAGQLAAELGLPAGAADQLADLYVEERDRQNEVWKRVRALESREESRRRLREEMRAVFEWRAAELVRRFGAEDAARIEAAENADVSEEL